MDFLRQREGTDRRGHKQEMTVRYRADKLHFANIGELKISLQSTMSERLRKMATEWTSYNTKLIRRALRENVGSSREQVQHNALCVALLFNLFFFLLL
jgi:hypothetical protein